MPNIKFNHRYRDAANYKNHDFIIFENDQSISLKEFEHLIKSKLIDGEYFYADDWKLPELISSFFDFKIDPTWHEFENVELTDEPTNSTLSLAEFVTLIQQTNRIN